MSTVEISVRVTTCNLVDDFTKQIIAAKKTIAENWVRTYLVPRSPRGGSNAGSSLQSNWYVITDGTTVIIGNAAQNAYHRVVGRGPSRGGNPGRYRQDMVRWVRAKGLDTASGQSAESIALAIIRSIARIGTQRWRDNENILGIDSRSGRLRENSPARELATQMEREIGRIQLGC